MTGSDPHMHTTYWREGTQEEGRRREGGGKEEGRRRVGEGRDRERRSSRGKDGDGR